MGNLLNPKLLIVQIVLVFLINIDDIESGKIMANFPFVELADYRFGLGDPYVVLYERENYRGKVHFHRLRLQCTNVDPQFVNWASSVDFQKRCVTLCSKADCTGHCVRMQSDEYPRSKRGVAYLQEYGLNDKVASVKFCYS